MQRKAAQLLVVTTDGKFRRIDKLERRFRSHLPKFFSVITQERLSACILLKLVLAGPVTRLSEIFVGACKEVVGELTCINHVVNRSRLINRAVIALEQIRPAAQRD